MKGYSKAAAHKGKVAYRTPSRMRPVTMKPMNKIKMFDNQKFGKLDT